MLDDSQASLYRGSLPLLLKETRSNVAQSYYVQKIFNGCLSINFKQVETSLSRISYAQSLQQPNFSVNPDAFHAM